MTQQDLQGIASQIAPGVQVRDPVTFERFLQEEAQKFATANQQPVLSPDEENFRLLQQAADLGVVSFPGLGSATNVQEANDVIRASIATRQRLQQFPLALERREAATGSPGQAALTGLKIFGAAIDPFGEILAQSGAQIGGERFGTAGAIAGGLVGGAVAPIPRLRPGVGRGIPTPGAETFPGIQGAVATGRGVDAAARTAIRNIPDGATVRSALDRVSPVGTARAAGPEDVEPPRLDPQDLRSAQADISQRLRAAEADAPPELVQTLTMDRVRETQRLRFQTQAAVKKLSAQLEVARPLRPEQIEALRKPVRSQRVGQLARQLEEGQGTEAFARGASELRGELPNPSFSPPVMTSDDIFRMTEHIRTLPNSRPLTKLNTQDALRKLLSGETPQTNELILLEKAFGRELVEAFMRRPRGIRGAASIITDLLGIPKTIRSAYDLSAPLRQGLLLGPRNPREFSAAFRDMFKSFNQQKAFQINKEIFDDPDIQRLVENGLFLHNVEGAGPAALIGREEAFVSRFASRIPGVGISERAYGTFLNKLRADVSKKTLNHWRSSGAEIGDDQLKSLSRFINVFTGRGSLGPAEPLGNALNIAFWSPRLLVSRFQAPTLLADPLVRRQAAENLVATFGLGITILALVEAALPGKRVEVDPRSTDFGKIRLGNTRIDFWGGFQQIARYMAQIATNQQKDPDTGKVYTPRDTQRIDRGVAFLRSKTSPGAATLLANELFGKTFAYDPLGKPPVRAPLPSDPIPFRQGAEAIGAETAREQEAIQQLAPLFALNVVDAMEENGIVGGSALSIPALFGVGTQTYNEPDATATPAPSSRSGIQVVPAR